MAKEDKKDRYFPHDYNACADEKIAEMLFYFRKNAKEFTSENLASYAALGLFWKIIEHLHVSTISEHKLYLLADEWRIDQEFLEKILKGFGLFEIKDGCFISKRVLENIELANEASKAAKARANARWDKYKEDKKAKEENIKADKELSKDRATENFLCTMCADYTSLNCVDRLKALNFYKTKLKTCTKENAVKKMLEYIKGGLQDEPQE